jgi:hypothetical protein
MGGNLMYIESNETQTRTKNMTNELKNLMAAERKAYKALMNDPAVVANPCAPHTPALWAAYEQAANAEREYRIANGI